MKLRILGVMTGTSCDALDASCVEFSEKGWKNLWSASASYPEGLRKRVLDFQKPNSHCSVEDFLTLERDLGLWYGSVLKRMILKRQKPDAIANHGQTVAHFPNLKGGGVSCQLGDPALIALATGYTTISHFRNGDLAAGGQGAPLAPLFHIELASKLRLKKSDGISFHNLGGMSNFTYLGPGNKVIATDTGPANAWIDEATSEETRGRMKYDKDGILALQGNFRPQTLEKLLKHPYFSKPLPKSTGRDDFPYAWFLKQIHSNQESKIRLATELTVETIARAYETWILRKKLPLRTIYLCGGGAKNKFLLKRLAERLTPVEVKSLPSSVLEPQYMEAHAFAYFGWRSLFAKSIGGSWTGADQWSPPARITPGQNWSRLVRKLQTGTQ